MAGSAAFNAIGFDNNSPDEIDSFFLTTLKHVAKIPDNKKLEFRDVIMGLAEYIVSEASEKSKKSKKKLKLKKKSTASKQFLKRKRHSQDQYGGRNNAVKEVGEYGGNQMNFYSHPLHQIPQFTMFLPPQKDGKSPIKLGSAKPVMVKQEQCAPFSAPYSSYFPHVEYERSSRMPGSCNAAFQSQKMRYTYYPHASRGMMSPVNVKQDQPLPPFQSPVVPDVINLIDDDKDTEQHGVHPEVKTGIPATSESFLNNDMSMSTSNRIKRSRQLNCMMVQQTTCMVLPDSSVMNNKPFLVFKSPVFPEIIDLVDEPVDQKDFKVLASYNENLIRTKVEEDSDGEENYYKILSKAGRSKNTKKYSNKENKKK